MASRGASKNYMNIGKSVLLSKVPTLKVIVFWFCELFSVRFFYSQAFRSYYAHEFQILHNFSLKNRILSLYIKIYSSLTFVTAFVFNALFICHLDMDAFVKALQSSKESASGGSSKNDKKDQDKDEDMSLD